MRPGPGQIPARCDETADSVNIMQPSRPRPCLPPANKISRRHPHHPSLWAPSYPPSPKLPTPRVQLPLVRFSPTLPFAATPTCCPRSAGRRRPGNSSSRRLPCASVLRALRSTLSRNWRQPRRHLHPALLQYTGESSNEQSIKQTRKHSNTYTHTHTPTYMHTGTVADIAAKPHLNRRDLNILSNRSRLAFISVPPAPLRTRKPPT
jgi:hypothetical protein